MKYHSDKCIPSSSMDETHQSQQYSNTNDTETNGFGSFLWNEEDDSDVGILFGFHKFSTLAKKIHQNIENVAKTINHSAREMMKEFADMEEHEYDDMDRIVGAEESSEDDVQLPFPWEFSSDNEKQEELQKRIFDLSANKALFDYNSAIQTQKEHTSIHSSFQLHSARIHLIQRIMKMDSNLSALYSYASGKKLAHRIAVPSTWSHTIFLVLNLKGHILSHIKSLQDKPISTKQLFGRFTLKNVIRSERKWRMIGRQLALKETVLLFVMTTLSMTL